MSGLGKKAYGGNGEPTLEELENRYNDSVGNIRKILGGVKDKRDLRTEEKQKLCTEYLRASQTAQKLAERYTDAAKSDEFADKIGRAHV